MIKTIAMNGTRQKVVIDAGVEIEKLSDRIQEKNCLLDGYGALFEGICITAPSDNL